MLKVFREDPETYVRRFVTREEKPKKSSRSMVCGTSVHMEWLENVTAVSSSSDPECPTDLRGARKYAKDKGFDEFFPVLNGKEGAAVRGMVDALRDDEFSSTARGRALWTERVVLWQEDTDVGLPVACKAKIDMVCLGRDGVRLVDLKTTRHATHGAFLSSVAEYGYAYQAAYYRAALAALGMDVEQCTLLAVCNKPPYPVFALDFLDETLQFARETNQLGLARLAEAAFNGWEL